MRLSAEHADSHTTTWSDEIDPDDYEHPAFAGILGKVF